MNWTAEEIRQLRYRMGWSQAEFARTLNLERSLITGWESGRFPPDQEHKSTLLRIFHQVESNCQKVLRRPVAEMIMKDRGLSQIHDFDVIDEVTRRA